MFGKFVVFRLFGSKGRSVRPTSVAPTATPFESMSLPGSRSAYCRPPLLTANAAYLQHLRTALPGRPFRPVCCVACRVSACTSALEICSLPLLLRLRPPPHCWIPPPSPLRIQVQAGPAGPFASGRSKSVRCLNHPEVAPQPVSAKDRYPRDPAASQNQQLQQPHQPRW